MKHKYREKIISLLLVFAILLPYVADVKFAFADSSVPNNSVDSNNAGELNNTNSLNDFGNLSNSNDSDNLSNTNDLSNALENTEDVLESRTDFKPLTFTHISINNGYKKRYIKELENITLSGYSAATITDEKSFQDLNRYLEHLYYEIDLMTSDQQSVRHFEDRLISEIAGPLPTKLEPDEINTYEFLKGDNDIRHFFPEIEANYDEGQYLLKVKVIHKENGVSTIIEESQFDFSISPKDFISYMEEYANELNFKIRTDKNDYKITDSMQIEIRSNSDDNKLKKVIEKFDDLDHFEYLLNVDAFYLGEREQSVHQFKSYTLENNDYVFAKSIDLTELIKDKEFLKAVSIKLDFSIIYIENPNRFNIPGFPDVTIEPFRFKIDTKRGIYAYNPSFLNLIKKNKNEIHHQFSLKKPYFITGSPLEMEYSSGSQSNAFKRWIGSSDREYDYQEVQYEVRYELRDQRGEKLTLANSKEVLENRDFEFFASPVLKMLDESNQEVDLPAGTYTIDMSFVALSNGEEEIISTQSFPIRVANKNLIDEILFRSNEVSYGMNIEKNIFVQEKDHDVVIKMPSLYFSNALADIIKVYDAPKLSNLVKLSYEIYNAQGEKIKDLTFAELIIKRSPSSPNEKYEFETKININSLEAGDYVLKPTLYIEKDGKSVDLAKKDLSFQLVHKNILDRMVSKFPKVYHSVYFNKSTITQADDLLLNVSFGYDAYRLLEELKRISKTLKEALNLEFSIEYEVIDVFGNKVEMFEEQKDRATVQSGSGFSRKISLFKTHNGKPVMLSHGDYVLKPYLKVVNTLSKKEDDKERILELKTLPLKIHPKDVLRRIEERKSQIHYELSLEKEELSQGEFLKVRANPKESGHNILKEIVTDKNYDRDKYLDFQIEYELLDASGRKVELKRSALKTNGFDFAFERDILLKQEKIIAGRRVELNLKEGEYQLKTKFKVGKHGNYIELKAQTLGFKIIQNSITDSFMVILSDSSQVLRDNSSKKISAYIVNTGSNTLKNVRVHLHEDEQIQSDELKTNLNEINVLAPIDIEPSDFKMVEIELSSKKISEDSKSLLTFTVNAGENNQRTEKIYVSLIKSRPLLYLPSVVSTGANEGEESHGKFVLENRGDAVLKNVVIGSDNEKIHFKKSVIEEILVGQKVEVDFSLDAFFNTEADKKSQLSVNVKADEVPPLSITVYNATTTTKVGDISLNLSWGDLGLVAFQDSKIKFISTQSDKNFEIDLKNQSIRAGSAQKMIGFNAEEILQIRNALKGEYQVQIFNSDDKLVKMDSVSVKPDMITNKEIKVSKVDESFSEGLFNATFEVITYKIKEIYEYKLILIGKEGQLDTDPIKVDSSCIHLDKGTQGSTTITIKNTSDDYIAISASKSQKIKKQKDNQGQTGENSKNIVVNSNLSSMVLAPGETRTFEVSAHANNNVEKNEKHQQFYNLEYEYKGITMLKQVMICANTFEGGSGGGFVGGGGTYVIYGGGTGSGHGQSSESYHYKKEKIAILELTTRVTNAREVALAKLDLTDIKANIHSVEVKVSDKEGKETNLGNVLYKDETLKAKMKQNAQFKWILTNDDNENEEFRAKAVIHYEEKGQIKQYETKEVSFTLKKSSPVNVVYYGVPNYLKKGVNYQFQIKIDALQDVPVEISALSKGTIPINVSGFQKISQKEKKKKKPDSNDSSGGDNSSGSNEKENDRANDKSADSAADKTHNPAADKADNEAGKQKDEQTDGKSGEQANEKKDETPVTTTIYQASINSPTVDVDFYERKDELKVIRDDLKVIDPEIPDDLKLKPTVTYDVFFADTKSQAIRDALKAKNGFNWFEMVKDPVDIKSGSQIITKELLYLDAAPVLDYNLYYNSLNRDLSPLGLGFTNKYEMHIHSDFEADEKTLAFYYDGINYSTFHKIEEEMLEKNIDASILKLFENQSNIKYFKAHDKQRQADVLVKHTKGYTLLHSNLRYELGKDGQLVKFSNEHGELLVQTSKEIAKTQAQAAGQSEEQAQPQSFVKTVSTPDKSKFIKIYYEELPKTNASNHKTDEQGNIKNYFVQKVEDSIGRTIRFKYDEFGKLVQITDVMGRNTFFTYDEKGRILSERDNLGRLIFQNTYDDKDRVISQTDETKGVTRFAYDIYNSASSDSNIVTNKLTNTLGDITFYKIDTKLLEVLEIKDAKGTVLSSEFDIRGNLVARTHKNEKISYDYDSKDRLIRVKEGANKVEYAYEERSLLSKPIEVKKNTDVLAKFSYNKDGKLNSVTDAFGENKSFGYEGNNLSSLNDNFGNSYNFKVDIKTGKITGVDAQGENLSYEYNALGDIVKITSSTGSKTFEYNEDGSISTVIDELGNTTLYEYDEVGDLKRITDALGEEKHYTWDIYKNLLSYTDEAGRVTRYIYDGEDRLLKEIYPDRSEVNYSYDVRGNVTRIQDEKARSTRFVYDENDYLIEEISPSERKTKYHYDKRGNLITKTLPNGALYQYEYNEKDELTKSILPSGKEITYQYDSLGRILKVKASGSTKDYVYDKKNLVKTATTYGNITQSVSFKYKEHLINQLLELKDDFHSLKYEYDTLGRIVGVSKDGLKTKVEYDKKSRVFKITDAHGNTKESIYDALDRVIKVIEKDKEGNLLRTSEISYDEVGNIKSLKDNRGNLFTLAYDSRNRLIEEKVQNSVEEAKRVTRITRYLYDKDGRLTQKIMPNGIHMHYEYDEEGNLIKVGDSLSLIYSFEYDEMGQVTKRTDALSNTYSYEYNKVGQMTKAISPKGDETEYSYDEEGNLIKVKEALGNEMHYRYNERGNLLEIKAVQADYQESTSTNSLSLPNNTKSTINNGSNSEHVSTYADNLRSTDQSQETTILKRFEYDDKGLLISVIQPDVRETYYEYDETGKITRRYEGDFISEYHYDKFNRLIEIRSDDDFTIFEYDNESNLIHIKNKEGSIKRVYDNNRRILQEQTPTGKTIHYRYNSFGNLLSTTLEDKTTSYEYDNYGNLTQVEDFKGNITTYEYDGRNRIIEERRSNGILTTYEYDFNNNKTRILVQNKKGEILSDEKISYDELGRVKTKENEVLSKRYGEVQSKQAQALQSRYEGAKLISKNTKQIKYDKSGNITTIPYHNILVDGTYNSANKLIKLSERGQKELHFTYDAFGSRISKVSKGRYNNYPRLFELTKEEYVQDHISDLTRVLEKTKEDAITGQKQSTYYIYGDGLISEIVEDGKVGASSVNGTTGTNNAISENHQNNADGVSSGSGTPTGTSQSTLSGKSDKDNAQIINYHYDYQGNTIFATNEQGEIISLYEYSPFGEERKQSGKDLDFTYSGKWGVQKEEYNLYYMRDRYYSSELHRFLSLDKDQGDLYRPSTLNPYAYVGNDPINFIDPSGMTAVNIANALKNAVFNEDGSLNWGGLFELGKFALSFSPIDFFIDLYDLGQSILAFDWTWGGLADIGLNVVGFLPGIGNFAKGGGKFIKTADAIADGVDLLSDAGKAITKAGGLFIAGKAAKKLGKTADAAKLAKHVSNGAEAFADSSKAAKALNKGSDALDAANDAGKALKNADEIGSGTKLAKKGEETVKYYRVQGGTDGNKVSVERITKSNDGKMKINKKNQTLYVSRETREHAEYYLKDRRKGGDIVEMEVPKWFDDFVMENIIEQENYKTNILNQGGMAPYRVDKTMPGFALALPSPWTGWFEEYGEIK